MRTRPLLTRRPLARLRRDRRGMAAVEFALVAPVLAMLLMGLFDLTYQAYAQALLDGSVQKAARDSSLEDNAVNGAAMDAKVEQMVKLIASNATVTTRRLSYSSFALIKPEYINKDTNRNGRLDSKDCFDDINGNGVWDEAPGRNGQGGADDVTEYAVTMTYPRLFPVAGLLGWSPNATLTSKTLLKNQPYKTQTVYTVQSVCLP